MTAVCVDASLAAKWILPEADRDLAQTLYSRWRAVGLDIIGPPLLLAEITNILRRNIFRGVINHAEALKAEEIFRGLGVLTVIPNELYREALILAERFDLPAAYDTQYLAVAQIQGCGCWTADERLYNRVSSDLPWLHLLDEISATESS